ncbi:phage structural protein [Domibacillus aminovorans]|uniref:DUF3277 domain-containing protein n=1 Tax=Domibacillus aminovorans TaxID=29332 RepID=A0A177L992_9BACI|nr:hypothetical protein [Domibacillus aminovorans]OAH61956.1 hypothetical protein AWH49_11070 [Domibacillus aminovorans]
MGSYNADLCVLTVGSRIITGFEEGTMVNSEKDEDFFSEKVDAQGEVIVSESNNPLGTITFTLSQTSPHVAYVEALAKNRTEFPIWNNYSGTPKEVTGGTRARIKKTAGKEYGDEASGREYEVKVFDYTSE